MTNGGPEPDELEASGLPELMDLAAAELRDVDRHATADGVDYALGDVLFAQVHGGRAAFRLRPEIAAAATRTDDAGPSHLGSEWVEFEPRTWDRYGLDRARAWFELGHRLAGEQKRAN